MTFRIIILFFLPILLSCSTYSQNNDQNISTELLLENQGVIWALRFLDSDRILFTERGGKIKIYSLSKKTTESVQHTLPSKEIGQGGLLDVQLHPAYPINSWVYFSYTQEKNRKYTTSIVRAHLNKSPPYQLTNITPIFEANAYSANAIHFGSRMIFDDQNYLYASIGERNEREKAQDLSVHHGKIIRILDNGKTPLDNPFLKTPQALPEIWSYGHRNPQGLVFDFNKKLLYAHEHGPKGGDELNLIKKGENYGWPVITYGREYYGPKIGEGTKKTGYQQPLYHWTPSIAPSGVLIYSGKLYKPWKGQFFIGSLTLTHLNKIELLKNAPPLEERFLSHLKERIRDVQEGPDGRIYLSTDSGKIFRIKDLHSKK